MDSAQKEKKEFNIELFKQTMDEAPTSENGWDQVFDGSVGKKYPDSFIRVYKKKMEGESCITTRIEGILINVDPAKFFQMMTDLPTMLKCEPAMKQLKRLEEINKNGDVIYIEAKCPFPLSDRDFVQQRLFVGNKEDPKLIKKLGLYDWKHRYYVVIQESVEREEYPPQKSPVRGTVKMSYWLLEEDPLEKNTVKFKAVACQDIGGKVPVSLLNSLGPKEAHRMFGLMMDNYVRIFANTEDDSKSKKK